MVDEAVEKVIAGTELFLRPTGRGHAQRYGDRRPMGYKGRRADGTLIIDTTFVVALPFREVYLYGREYRRQIAEGCVEQVDAAAYRAHIARDAGHQPEPAKASHDAAAKAQKSTAKAAAGAPGTESGGKPPKE
jgi:hypothetical protein